MHTVRPTLLIQREDERLPPQVLVPWGHDLSAGQLSLALGLRTPSDGEVLALSFGPEAMVSLLLDEGIVVLKMSQIRETVALSWQGHPITLSLTPVRPPSWARLPAPWTERQRSRAILGLSGALLAGLVALGLMWAKEHPPSSRAEAPDTTTPPIMSAPTPAEEQTLRRLARQVVLVAPPASSRPPAPSKRVHTTTPIEARAGTAATPKSSRAERRSPMTFDMTGLMGAGASSPPPIGALATSDGAARGSPSASFGASGLGGQHGSQAGSAMLGALSGTDGSARTSTLREALPSDVGAARRAGAQVSLSSLNPTQQATWRRVQMAADSRAALLNTDCLKVNIENAPYRMSREGSNDWTISPTSFDSEAFDNLPSIVRRAAPCTS